MVYDGTLPRATAACLAWAGLPLPGKRGETSRGEARPTAWRRLGPTPRRGRPGSGAPRPKATENSIGRCTTMVAGPLGQYRQLRQTPAPSLCGVDTGPPHEG